MFSVKKLTSFFEGLSKPNEEPSQKVSSTFHHGYKQPLANRENTHKSLQTQEPGTSREGNRAVEKSSNDKEKVSLLDKISYKLPGLFKGSLSQLEKSEQTYGKGKFDTDLKRKHTKQAEESSYLTSTREELKGIARDCVRKDEGHLLGSNRNIAYLVDDDQKAKDESYKRQTSTQPLFSETQTENLYEKIGNSKSESTCEFRSSLQFSDDNVYNKKESSRDEHTTPAKNGKWKSTTTMSSSGIYTGTFTDRNSVPAEKHRTESDCCRTERYVEKIRNNGDVPQVKKYPSEPTVMPQPKQKQKALTQENVFNMGGSSIGFYASGNESVTVSQTSVFSSSEQEIRDAIEEQTSDCLKEFEILFKIPLNTRVLKRARDVIEKEGLVILIGNDGSGSTSTAWTLLSESNSKKKYNLLDVSSDFAVCMHSKENITIIVDDAFGDSKLQDVALETCLKYAKMCKMKKSSRNLKLIFTVKHHIADQCKRQLEDYKKNIVDLEDPKLQIDCDEMLDISKAIVHNNEEELKIELTSKDTKKKSVPCKGREYISESFLLEITENALPSGFPKRFKQFIDNRNNIRQGLRYFTHPTKDLLLTFRSMKTSKNQDDLAKYLTLVMVAVCGDKLKLEDVSGIEQFQNRCAVPSTCRKTKKRAKSKSKAKSCDMDIPWWIEIVNLYMKHCKSSLLESVKTGLGLLKTSYIKEETKGVFVFAAPCVKNATLITIGQDFQQHMLKLSDLQFFKEYISSKSYFGEDSDQHIGIDTHIYSLRRIPSYWKSSTAMTLSRFPNINSSETKCLQNSSSTSVKRRMAGKNFSLPIL